ncbi:MAG: DEAD/DEAH box helicase, partial [Chitinophagaceae bacterium]|nr:DEAD/DEAH box helicase [Chitinophagaceae bacterium]
MKFTQYNFNEELQQGIDSQGFKRATDIQFKAIPCILKGEDVMAIAATGTGKTAAYAIPIIEKLIQQKEPSKGPAALILAPTRELVTQIAEVFEKLAAFSGLLIVPVTGGVDQENQISQLKEGADIVVATPGRIFDLRAQGHLSLSAIKIFVLDESDRMMDMGFMKDVVDIKSRLPKKHQTLFFSATINEEL